MHKDVKYTSLHIYIIPVSLLLNSLNFVQFHTDTAIWSLGLVSFSLQRKTDQFAFTPLYAKNLHNINQTWHLLDLNIFAILTKDDFYSEMCHTLSQTWTSCPPWQNTESLVPIKIPTC